MHTNARSSSSRWRHAAILLAIAGAILMIAATPAMAADGVRVLPSPSPSPTNALTAGLLSEWQADTDGGFVAYLQGSINPPNDWNAVALKSLDDDHAPFLPYWNWAWSTPGPTFGPLTQFHPSIAVASGTIYVVWQQMDQSDPFDSDIWIWQGTYNGVTDEWTPTNSSFPKALITGDVVGAPAPMSAEQRNPDVGVVNTPGGDHVVVAWEDSRPNGYDAMLVYFIDLTADTAYQDPAWSESAASPAGVAVDATPVWARGQRQPDVGLKGIFWLDERYSLWSESGLSNTAIWRYDFVSGSPGLLWRDTTPGYDNGEEWSSELGPVGTGTGAAWMRRGPYGGGGENWQPFTVNASTGVGSTIAHGSQPVGIDADHMYSSLTTGYVWLDHHVYDRDLDYDVFYCGGPGRPVVPVCNVGWPSGTVLTEAATPQWWRRTQTGPAIGPAPGGYRVVWSDARDSIGVGDEDNADMRLYEAFVPTLTFRIRDASILWSARFRFTTTVSPNFTLEPVYLQRVRLDKQNGGSVYLPIKGASVKATLNADSSASWSWKPPAKGTYYFRVWFAGASKYNADGLSTSDKYRLVPHIANGSQVIRVVAK
jgi:hypothetical protein